MNCQSVFSLLALALWVLSFGAALAQDEAASEATPGPASSAETEAVRTEGALAIEPGDLSSASPAESLRDRELEAYVDGLIATWQTVHGAPGYTVAVVRPDGNVFTKGYGLADVEAGVPVDPAATRFHVASISKTFVWTAAMMLVERGVLDLDEDVNSYLERYTVPDGDRPLTLRDLMSHRAGVEENLDLWSVEVAAMDRADAIAASEPRQVFPRGERAAYSNWGSNLTTLIIEDATGRNYAEFLFTEILDPLGMTATALTDGSPAASDPATPVAVNYRVGSSGPEALDQLDIGAFAPIGGMTTTANDMARWMRFHLNRGELDGVRLMAESTYDDLRTRDFDPVPGAAGRARGFGDTPYRSISYYGHTGSINAFYSKFSISPELGLGVFIAQNTSDDFDPLNSVPHLVFDRVLALRGELPPPITTAEPTEDDIAAAEEVAGRYLTTRRVHHGPLKFLAAMEGPLEITADDGRLIGSHPNAPFVRIGEDLWENRLGARLAFARDEYGRISHVITPGGATDAVPVTWRNDPLLLWGSLGATLLFSITTWLGFWRRVRQQRETHTAGRILSAIALLATLPFVWLGVLAARLPDTDALDFAEVFANWPLPFLADLSLAATVMAGVGLVMVVCAIPAWTSTGWNLLRRIHFMLFAAAYGLLAWSLVNWGLAAIPA
jgi:CubicO group peptidase (beta-lactamase class C family)